MSARYEIREQEPSDNARALGLNYPLYVVWDKELNKRVPFGCYSDRTRAEMRIQRMEARP